MNASLHAFSIDRFNWHAWEKLIELHGVTIDRPYQSIHPDYPSIVYPINYGYINNTMGSDQEEVDIFIGTATNKLVAAIVTTDFRKGDREWKFIYNCTPEEIYLVNGFINYAPDLLTGRLLMRQPMKKLWFTEAP